MHAADFIPETLIEATRHFEDLDVATEFVAKMRWPHGIACPRCGSVKHGYVPSRRIWNCHGCRKQFSVKVGTIMEDSPIGLDKWLVAMWLLSGCKNGISSHEIARDLGVSQKTAWFLMHRIRTAMQNGSIEKFDGTVEVDETFIGGKAKNMHKAERAKKIKGTGTVGKAIVLGLLARTDGDGPSQVKAKVVSSTRRRTLRPEIEALVEDGATVYTDALKSYDGLDAEYVHATVDHAVKYAEGAVHTNGMENFWSQLRPDARWFLRVR